MDIIIKNADLIIERMELSSFATNAYIVICPRTSSSALIDAPAGAWNILRELKDTELKWILLTHSHVDHFSGLQATFNRVRAPLGIHEADNHKWLPFPPDRLLQDHEWLTIGKVKIKVIHTPGHTPGSLCFKIGKYLLAGDTLFPGGPGRTTDPEAFQQIIHSIKTKIMTLPDEVEIYPGHGAPVTLKKAREEYANFASRSHDYGLYGDILWATS
jgi:hydroxyacylglutathione hydrolase